ncbi:DUF4232 domain-containing protein [Streptomyces sp. NPDC002513]
MVHRRAVPTALACCAVLVFVLTGCANSDGSPAPDDSVSASSGTGSGSGATTGSGSGATGGGNAGTGADGSSPSTRGGAAGSSTASPATDTRCHTDELRASIGPNHPGAGQENFSVILTNGSQRTCTVHGFPGVAFVNGAGQAVTPDPERVTGQEEQAVTLAPGARAWSGLSFTNPAVTGVTTVTPTAVLVTPPDETASLKVAWTGGKVSNTGKASVPQLTPFRPGDGG